MHSIFINTPVAFNRSNVVCIQIFLDFISVLVIMEFKCGAIMSFVDVLVNVLDSINWLTKLSQCLVLFHLLLNSIGLETHTNK